MNGINQTVHTIVIIGLIGDARVGKDTLATHLIRDHGFKRLAFADPIKQVAKALFQMTDEQCNCGAKDLVDSRWNITPRQFFQQFGTDIMQRDIYKYLPMLSVPPLHFWSQRLVKELEADVVAGISKFVITDIRFLHEYEDLVELKTRLEANASLSSVSFKTIKIVRNSQTTGTHLSQTELQQLPDADILLYNNGTLEEYEARCVSAISELL